MCHLAIAGIAASLETSCVTAVSLLLGSWLQAEVCKQPLDLPLCAATGVWQIHRKSSLVQLKSCGETLAVC